MIRARLIHIQHSCLRAVVIVIITGACSRTANAQPFFDSWVPNGPLDQSSIDIDGNPDNGVQPAHSKLVGRPGVPAKNWVSDTDLGGATMGGLAINNNAEIMWVFGQCYGGGFLDELNALGGKQVAGTAARHDETARYPLFCNAGGVRADWIDAYAHVFAANITALDMIDLASTDDPWGTNPGLAMPGACVDNMIPPYNGPALLGMRRGEAVNSEHPQFYTIGNGAAIKIELTLPQNRLAILWSGQPNWVDEGQIATMVDKLLAMNHLPSRIFILFRNGKVPPANIGGRIALNIGAGAGQVPAANVRVAEKCALEKVFNDHYGVGKPNPELLFFFANDHGANTGQNNGNATPRHAESPNNIPDLPSDESDWPGSGEARGDGGCVLQPTGACCFGDELCTLTSDTDCANLGGTFAGDDVYCAQVSCQAPCPADIAVPHDGVVNVTDLFILLANWATNGPGADLAPPLNIVNVSDLFALLSQWGDCP